MKASFRLGRVMGIEIGIHVSWLIIFALLTWSLAAAYYPQLYPGWGSLTYWTLGVLSSLLLFASVLAHELGHSWVAIGMTSRSRASPCLSSAAPPTSPRRRKHPPVSCLWP